MSTFSGVDPKPGETQYAAPMTTTSGSLAALRQRNRYRVLAELRHRGSMSRCGHRQADRTVHDHGVQPHRRVDRRGRGRRVARADEPGRGRRAAGPDARIQSRRRWRCRSAPCPRPCAGRGHESRRRGRRCHGRRPRRGPRTDPHARLRGPRRTRSGGREPNRTGQDWSVSASRSRHRSRRPRMRSSPGESWRTGAGSTSLASWVTARACASMSAMTPISARWPSTASAPRRARTISSTSCSPTVSARASCSTARCTRVRSVAPAKSGTSPWSRTATSAGAAIAAAWRLSPARPRSQAP